MKNATCGIDAIWPLADLRRRGATRVLVGIVIRGLKLRGYPHAVALRPRLPGWVGEIDWRIIDTAANRVCFRNLPRGLLDRRRPSSDDPYRDVPGRDVPGRDVPGRGATLRW